MCLDHHTRFFIYNSSSAGPQAHYQCRGVWPHVFSIVFGAALIFQNQNSLIAVIVLCVCVFMSIQSRKNNIGLADNYIKVKDFRSHVVHAGTRLCAAEEELVLEGDFLY
jgi:hypothetical protein